MVLPFLLRAVGASGRGAALEEGDGTVKIDCYEHDVCGGDRRRATGDGAKGRRGVGAGRRDVSHELEQVEPSINKHSLAPLMTARICSLTCIASDLALTNSSTSVTLHAQLSTLPSSSLLALP